MTALAKSAIALAASREDHAVSGSANQPSVHSKYPSLYQINTRALIQELSQDLKRQATLDDIPDSVLDRLAAAGFSWVWFLGVWQTGNAGHAVSCNNPEWLTEFRHVLPDFTIDDVCGSCFAVAGYKVHSDFGGNIALERLGERIHQRGMKLLLDFVPNHTALDHPWVQKYPEFYVPGNEELLQREPQNYVRVNTPHGHKVLAYGRDPYFSGWPDTLQLNYANPALQEAMQLELLNVSSLCDGVRCDMAMLILPDVFERTWGRRPPPFWPKTIQSIRAYKPDFLFMAEVYWDLEWTLQEQGFNYTYDKRLYDRLRDGHARPVRDHFRAGIDFQRRSARFLENHDEPRAAATFRPDIHRAAAVLTFLCPGLRFFHDGQFDGRVKKLSVHLGRRPSEPTDASIRELYQRLLACVHLPAIQNGLWQLLEPTSAWEGNWTWDCFIGFAWHDSANAPLVVVANYAPNQSQCYMPIPLGQIQGKSVILRDLMSDASYERIGDDLFSRGLYLDMPAWGYHVFQLELSPISRK